MPLCKIKTAQSHQWQANSLLFAACAGSWVDAGYTTSSILATHPDKSQQHHACSQVCKVKRATCRWSIPDACWTKQHAFHPLVLGHAADTLFALYLLSQQIGTGELPRCDVTSNAELWSKAIVT